MFSAEQICRWHYRADFDRLINELREKILHLSHEAIQSSGKFSIVLSGGFTPQMLYQKLVDLQTDWSKWEIYFGDERCLPEGHQDRNDTMAKNAWLNHIAIPDKNIHIIHAEKLEAGASDYVKQLEGLENFDLVLLGLGEDGHTASLFPFDDSGLQKSSPSALLINHSPKPPSQRISLSAQRLSQARHVWFLVAGNSKREALKKWKAGENLPARFITPEAGVDIFTDQLIG